jgi:hypothetical protein
MDLHLLPPTSGLTALGVGGMDILMSEGSPPVSEFSAARECSASVLGWESVGTSESSAHLQFARVGTRPGTAAQNYRTREYLTFKARQGCRVCRARKHKAISPDFKTISGEKIKSLIEITFEIASGKRRFRLL